MATEGGGRREEKEEKMDDLISRRAAIAAMTNYFARWAEYTAWSKTVKAMVETAQEAAREMLTELPSAQPEIIRCKECKRWNTVHDRTKAEYGLCQIRTQLEATKKDDWCSRAERRENG